MNLEQIKREVIAKLAKIKSKKGIYAFVSKPEDYLTVNKAICSYLINNLKSCGIYVSLNKSCRDMSEIFDKERIDTKRLLFIECTGQEKKVRLIIAFLSKATNL